MKTIAIVILIIYLVPVCAIFASGLMLPKLRTLSEELQAMEDQMADQQGDLENETEAKEEAEVEIANLKAQLEQADQNLEAKQAALDQSINQANSLYIRLIETEQLLDNSRKQAESAEGEVQALKVKLDIALKMIEKEQAAKGIAQAEVNQLKQELPRLKSNQDENLTATDDAVGKEDNELTLIAMASGLGASIAANAVLAKLIQKNRPGYTTNVYKSIGKPNEKL